MHALRVDAIVLYDDTRAAYNFASVTLLVDLAEASPRSYGGGVNGEFGSQFGSGLNKFTHRDALGLRP